jgi:methionyl-tRNA formyltransferase
MRKLRVLLVGEEAAGIQTLRMLSSSMHTVVSVVASPPNRLLGVTLTQSLWTVAAALGYPTLPAELVRDAGFATCIKSEGVDLLLNVHSLYLINSEILRAPAIGCFNLHPAALPRYAGLNSVSWAIYYGEIIHGVTVHQMVPEIDAGTIAYQALFPIEPTDNGLSLSAKCTRDGLRLLGQLLDDASRSADAIPRIPQDLSQRSYFGRAVPAGGMLSWSAPARDVLNFVRACDFHPFPSAWGNPRTRFAGRDVAIAKASRTGRRCQVPPGTVYRSGDSIEVATEDEWVSLHRVIVDRQRLHPMDLLKNGDRLESIAPAA